MKYFPEIDSAPNPARLKLEERETSFLYDDANPTCYCFTCNPALMRKLDGFVSKRPDVFTCTKHYGDCAFYEFPKKYVSVRLPKEMSEEQREAAGARMREAQRKKGDNG